MKEHQPGTSTFLLAFEKGDDLLEILERWLDDRDVVSSSLSGIGAFRRCRLGYFRKERRDYDEIPVDEQVELTSLLGNSGVDDSGNVKIHLHATVAKQDGSAVGGHLLHGEVWPTVELFVEVLERPLIRHEDDETGLPLLTEK